MNTTHPKKRLGQNFLTDKNIARKIINAIDVPVPRLIIEIGPGQGALTDLLLDSGDQYLGIEIDPGLAEILQKRFSTASNFMLLKKDFLDVDISKITNQFSGKNVVVIGNIPYNITSPILFKLFDNADILTQSILMMQKEVGQRLSASPSTKAYGLLAINSQLFAEVRPLFTVPAKLFFPKPKVDSVVVKLDFKKNVREAFADFELFRKVLRHCFQHRRKMLRKTLSMLFSPTLLTKLGADLTRRPEQLSISEWRELTNSIYGYLHEEQQ